MSVKFVGEFWSGRLSFCTKIKQSKGKAHIHPQMLTVGSLFSGIGGFDLGLERAGMKVLWQVEIDEWCRKVLAKHWPDVERFGDICNVTKEELKPVQLICGGFPCQPFSNAGKRKGKADDRYLWPEMLRVISEVKPRWVVGENVAGLINMELENMLTDLEAEGYEVEAFVLPACAIGANHRRDRVWIVAHTGCQRVYKRWGIGNAERENSGQGRMVTDGLSEGEKEQGKTMADSESERFGNGDDGELQRQTARKEYTPTSTSGYFGELETGGWAIEPGVGRVADGISHRVDRLRGLGNAVVPQLVEVLGRYIIEADKILFEDK